MTLVLEASTYAGSAALLHRGRLVGERNVAMRGREHEALMAAVGQLMSEADTSPTQLERIVCGAGPGSFTSLRIAGSIAKGLALASDIPLVPISSLTLLAASLGLASGARVLATLDAMRGEVYAQLHGVGAVSGEVEPFGDQGLVAVADVAALAASLGATVAGAGSGAAPRAAAASNITKMIAAARPADLAGWEPAYGRLAEAQVKWEAVHGRALAV